MESLFDDAESSLQSRDSRKFGEAVKGYAYDEASQIIWDAMGEKWFNNKIKLFFGKDNISKDRMSGASVCLLPKIANGPVITTNFDCVLEKVYGDFHPYNDVVTS